MSVHSNGSLEAAPTLLEQVAIEPRRAAKVFVRDLADGQQVETPFVVRECIRREKRNGDKVRLEHHVIEKGTIHT